MDANGNITSNRDNSLTIPYNDLTYPTLIKLLCDHGFENIGTSDAVPRKNHVFLQHLEADALIALPTTDHVVLAPHMMMVKRVLRDNGMLEERSTDLHVRPYQKG